jgi:hypothetical protein
MTCRKFHSPPVTPLLAECTERSLKLTNYGAIAICIHCPRTRFDGLTNPQRHAPVLARHQAPIANGSSPESYI